MFKIILPKFKFSIERWKWNKEYRIYVSTLGHIKNEYKQNIPMKISKGGYCYVYTNCGYKSIHRLVLLTFKPIPNAENLTVDHLNHNKRDNTIYNLEWVTKRENLIRERKDFLDNNNKINNGNNNKIICGQEIFATIEEGANWIIKKQGMDKNLDKPNIEKVIKNIQKAINNNSLYCGKRWNFIQS